MPYFQDRKNVETLEIDLHVLDLVDRQDLFDQLENSEFQEAYDLDPFS